LEIFIYYGFGFFSVSN